MKFKLTIRGDDSGKQLTVTRLRWFPDDSIQAQTKEDGRLFKIGTDSDLIQEGSL